ncbi:ribosome-binding factor A [bacterium CG2_30_33_46]|nr:MAG: ribosome-binding factor A [bacterium CG2_30_33_46]PJA72415.1 MAG: ribosome-binding factor A [bacterium CG_4_9_14_3_um_filter_33_26]
MIKRIDRVNELIKQELSKLIGEYFKLKDILITVTRVKTEPDLRSAEAFISIFPFAKAEETLKQFKEILPRIQHILDGTIELKYIPKIQLFLDESLEYESNIERLLDKIKDSKMKH